MPVFASALKFLKIGTPATPNAGEVSLYFKSDDKLYYKTSAGVEALVDAPPSYMVGEIKIWPSSTIPVGWYPCDGRNMSTTTFALLFAVIGYTWGGSGGTFNLPDSKRRLIRGTGSSSPVGQTDSLAEADRTLTHGHSVGTLGATGGNVSRHTHVVSPITGNATWVTPNTGTNTVPRNVAFDGHSHGGVTGGGADSEHTHNVTGITGGNSGVEALPFAVFNTIIYSGI